MKGPILYAPQPNEWIHEFVWHGEDGNHKTHIVPGAKQFQKLRLIPDQFYYNIADVRTSDDALIVVKLMVFYELLDVDTMLNNTRDPIADFVSDHLSFDISLFIKDSFRSTPSVRMSLLLLQFVNTRFFSRMQIN